MTIDFLSTFKDSYAGQFYPKGWDWEKIRDITALASKEQFAQRQDFWHADFIPEICDDSTGGFEALATKMGYEIFAQVKAAADSGQKLAMILPVGPMGMYKWAVYFSIRAGQSWSHVHCFNMDEWSDKDGNTAPTDAPGSFQGAMEQALYGPLGELTVPKENRNFATRDNLPTYSEKIAALRERGAKLIVVYGIGRACHIAFWEPHFGEEFNSDDQWRQQTHRLGANLHPLTIEQNSLHSFASRLPLIPLRANTIGPGLFTNADYAIGGCDGAHGPLNWQGQSVWMTLRYGPTRFVSSSWMPTMAGRLFVIKVLAGALNPDAH